MVELGTPTVLAHVSFLAAMAEFRAEGRGSDPDFTAIGHEMRTFGASWASADGFAAYVQWLVGPKQLPAGYVPSTDLWLLDGDEYLGRIAVRHRLTERLLEVGGHIGYDVRPSARRRGHATRMLADALVVARDLGIASALLTCDAGNLASRRVIERNGGVFEDERHGTLRFWVPTGA